MPDAASFSPDYSAARARFLAAAHAAAWTVERHGIGLAGPDGDELTIDVARRGPERPERVVIVSSGLHGVEGFFGSAVQCALLEEGLTLPERTAVVLVHALNPYGFAFLRRFNEGNVDLNRNFLLDGERFSGAPARYASLDPLLNPKTPPRFDGFLPRALWAIGRYGMGALKDAVAGGQYDFPQGLFYGGSEPARSQVVLRDHLGRWIGPAARRVLHVDLHTGLGANGTYKLLVDHRVGAPGAEALARVFGPAVQPWSNTGVSYAIRGGLGSWCKARFPRVDYDVLVAEFGTVPVLQVVGALRAENRAHHWGNPEDPTTRKAKERLRDVFAPPEEAWRTAVVEQGVTIVAQALAAP
jgi:hypothetical protein